MALLDIADRALLCAGEAGKIVEGKTKLLAAGLDAAAGGCGQRLVRRMLIMWRWRLFQKLESPNETMGGFTAVFDQRYVVAREAHTLGKLGLGNAEFLTESGDSLTSSNHNFKLSCCKLLIIEQLIDSPT